MTGPTDEYPYDPSPPAREVYQAVAYLRAGRVDADHWWWALADLLEYLADEMSDSKVREQGDAVHGDYGLAESANDVWGCALRLARGITRPHRPVDPTAPTALQVRAAEHQTLAEAVAVAAAVIDGGLTDPERREEAVALLADAAALAVQRYPALRTGCPVEVPSAPPPWIQPTPQDDGEDGG